MIAATHTGVWVVFVAFMLAAWQLSMWFDYWRGKTEMAVEDLTDDIYGRLVLPFQQKANPEYVAKLQATMQAFAADGREVTIDDAWDICPPPPNVDPRILGAAFYPKKLWLGVGHCKSRRKINHGRPVAKWRLRAVAQ
jgi:hypothetical protein